MKGNRFLWALTCLVSGLALAQAPSLEDLEKRIEQGKKAKEQKDRAASRSSGKKSEASGSAETASPAPSRSQGRLVIEVDAPCELKVNGERKASLEPGSAKVVTVDAGEQLIECQSQRVAQAKVRQVVDVKAGAQAVLTLSIQGQMRYLKTADGTVRAGETGLEWTASDNGSDVNWNQAQSYCAGKGGNWRLPTSAELQGLFDGSGALTTPCGSKTCKVAPAFRLSSYWSWSGERNGSSEAWIVILTDGSRESNTVGSSTTGRALCVRRP